MDWRERRLHFVGIGGAGMSGLAVVAAQLGARVSGSDRSPDSRFAERVRAAGATIYAGHAAEHVPEAGELVVSTAIPADNPERVRGRELGLRELHRSELLGELTRLRPTIAVAGTHGKTTTSSMLVSALLGAGIDPSYLVGGEVRATGTNAAWGRDEWLVVEADESDRSLLALSPTVAVLTNAELDHQDVYASRREVDATFAEFLALAEHRVVWDRPELLALVPDGSARPFDATAVDLDGGGSRFAFGHGVDVQLSVPGLHNARNAAAALAACAAAGIDVAAAAAGLREFTGAGRRFEPLGTSAAGAAVVDDYAHHPTEVRATLEAARTLEPGRVVAVFQPHLFSRTELHARAFGEALALADRVVVLDVYPARERAEDFPGVSGLRVAEATVDAGAAAVAWLPGFDAAADFLEARLRPGDLCLTLGAGDVDALGRRLVASASPPAG